MSKKSHNKKRNVGIIYEQLITKISSALIDNDDKTALEAKKLIKKYFQPGTELHKEHKLFNALAVTRISDNILASQIMEEAKNASRNHSHKTKQNTGAQIASLWFGYRHLGGENS